MSVKNCLLVIKWAWWHSTLNRKNFMSVLLHIRTSYAVRHHSYSSITISPSIYVYLKKYTWGWLLPDIEEVKNINFSGFLFFIYLFWDAAPTISFLIFWDLKRCFANFSFHDKWNDVRLLLINMVYTSSLTSCRTT